MRLFLLPSPCFHSALPPPASSTLTVTRPIVDNASSSLWTMSVRPSVVVETLSVSSPA